MSALKDKLYSASLGRKLYFFIILTVFVTTFVTARESYRIAFDQVDIHYKRLALNTAINFASMVDGDYLEKLRTVAESEEYQALRDKAEADEDEEAVRSYLKLYGLWDEYDAIRGQLDSYIENMFDIEYLYIIAWGDAYADHDMYLVDDSDNPLYETGYYEVRESELMGIDAYSGVVQPTVSKGDWGWLCSAYAPVYNSSGKVVCQVGCDISMNELMRERYSNFFYSLMASFAITLIVLIISIVITSKLIINPLRRITLEMTRFSPSNDGDYEKSGVIDMNLKYHDEIYAIYNELRKMQTRTVDDLYRILRIQQEKKLVEKESEAKDKEIDEISEQAYCDSLTQAGTKAAFNRDAAGINAELEKSDVQFAVVMVDANGLKTINDTYGHSAGDIYLRGVCDIFRSSFPGSDIYRIGGDEFVAIVKGEEYRNRKELLTKMRKTYEKASSVADKAPCERYSAAAGIADHMPGERSVEHVLSRADADMYKDKERIKGSR